MGRIVRLVVVLFVVYILFIHNDGALFVQLADYAAQWFTDLLTPGGLK